MEEKVGIFWHRLLGKALNKDLPSQQTLSQRQVSLNDVKRKMSIIFRSIGLNGQLSIEPSFERSVQTRRSIIQKIAGLKPMVYSAWIEDDVLYLPEEISLFSTKKLNESLYFWLTAMAASDLNHAPEKKQLALDNYWFIRNQELTLYTLKQFPGLADSYEEMLSEILAARPKLEDLSTLEQQQEQAIRDALIQPGSQTHLISTKFQAVPVPLWLIQSISKLSNEMDSDDLDNAVEQQQSSGPDEEQDKKSQKKRKQAERVKMPDGKTGLITVRMENIFSWAEFLKVDRTTDDDEDPNADKVADDMDHLSIARDKQAPASKINFNLDLPAAAYDDTVLSEGILYPEWHYKEELLVSEQASIIPMIAREAEAAELPPSLYQPARKVRRLFEALIPARKWFKGEFEGSELDLDAFIQFNSDRYQSGDEKKSVSSEQGLYRQFKPGFRDLSTLLLADLSLSTDTSINNEHKVIDVIRDSLFLFSEALTQTGDKYALYGFSSRKKEHVRYNQIKTFDEPMSAMVRGRINAIKPGYYTRLGAAIRHSCSLLLQQASEQKILLILTDGKPNDLDHYEGRYGIEDTRHAVLEARNQGLHPFCFTIDKEGSEYLPHLFGANGYSIIRKPEELPTKLPLLYAELSCMRS